MTTQRQTVRRPTGPRRQRKWAPLKMNENLSNLEVSIKGLNLTLSTAQQEESTLVRTLICITILPLAPTSSGADGQLVSIGVGVASLEAFGAGAAAVASPSVAGEEPLQGWLYQCEYWLLEGAGHRFAPILVDKDLGAARKLGSGVPFVRVENNPGNGTVFSVRVAGFIRTLYLLA